MIESIRKYHDHTWNLYLGNNISCDCLRVNRGEEYYSPEGMHAFYERCSDCNLRERVRGSNLAAPECNEICQSNFMLIN